jgi:hypothetical protein
MASRPAATRHPSQLLALGIGAVYTLVGLLGFVVTGLGDFAAEIDKTLLGFELNPLHNLVHLLIGLAGLALWRRLDTTRTYGWLLMAGYGLVFIFGLFAAGNPDINFLSLNAADNVLAPGQRPGWRGDRPLAGRSGHRPGAGRRRASLTATTTEPAGAARERLGTSSRPATERR